MTVTVTNFKAHCLEILREVERSNQPVEISKQGQVRFRIIPVRTSDKPPWERLQSCGALLSQPGESVLKETDFDAMQ